MALRECVTLGIRAICLLDTNSNDDAETLIRLILNKLVHTICEGHSSYMPNC
ncbi:hypothetical protein MKW94_027508 [Papaver nudicaule]|uniref:Uncharacterized protein n=1 Tax=Papaver nudicaule TaxID=74823 RepID=A0AA41VBD7_PAPNU|nr:hypothetical protein [Papaver nudicaule]